MARIGIIGSGPRGLVIFERLCANSTLAHGKLEVFMFDPYQIGPGSIWRIDQSKDLIMNTVCSQISVFTDPSVDIEGPIIEGPSLYEWCIFIRKINKSIKIPQHLRHEASTMHANSYPSRSIYGAYLRWSLEYIRDQYNQNLLLTEVNQKVTNLTQRKDLKIDLHLDNDEYIKNFDCIILTLGHFNSETSVRFNIASDKENKAFYFGPQNASDANLDLIPAGSHVIIAGLGLTFFDYMALLTSGRNGTFYKNDNKMHYIPSGEEPIIFACSKRGIPYHARGENQKDIHERHIPKILTKEMICHLKENGPISFKSEVWPLIALEVEMVYYEKLLSQKKESISSKTFHETYKKFLDADYDSKINFLLNIGIQTNELWDWDLIMNPANNLGSQTKDSFQNWMLSYLNKDIHLAMLGNVDGPTKSALDILRDLRNEIREIVDYGGVFGESYHTDLDKWYTPLNAFLSIGPPVRRIEELVALMESGIVTMIGPDAIIDYCETAHLFFARSPKIYNSKVIARTFIEARLHKTDIRKSHDSLVKNLVSSGMARSYKIKNTDGTFYETGGIDINPFTHQLISYGGKINPNIYAFGIPTESVRWVTAAGPRPGVNSVTFVDADQIARLVLTQVAKTMKNDTYPDKENPVFSTH